jgi:hypothetical protein
VVVIDDRSVGAGMTFVELFMKHNRLLAKKIPQRQFLDEMLQQATALGLRIWRRRDATSARGRRILLGVVPWSLYDMEALDAVCYDFKGALFEIFIVDECGSQADFEDFVPGVGPVWQTPVVGIWEDGRLVEKAWGFEGRQLLKQYGK